MKGRMDDLRHADALTRVIVLEAGGFVDERVCALACSVAREQGRRLCEKDLNITCPPCSSAHHASSGASAPPPTRLQ